MKKSVIQARARYDSIKDRIIHSAKSGCCDCQFIVGEMYEFGRGVDASMDEAVKWYKLSADEGNSDAKTRIEQGFSDP